MRGGGGGCQERVPFSQRGGHLEELKSAFVELDVVLVDGPVRAL